MSSPIIHVITGTGLVFLSATFFGVKFGKDKTSKELGETEREPAGPPVVAFRFDQGFERSSAVPQQRADVSSAVAPLRPQVVDFAPAFEVADDPAPTPSAAVAEQPLTNGHAAAPTITPWWEESSHAQTEPFSQNPEALPDPLDVLENAAVHGAPAITHPVVETPDPIAHDAQLLGTFQEAEAHAQPFDAPTWAPTSIEPEVAALPLDVATDAPLNESEEEERGFDEDEYQPAGVDAHLATILRQPAEATAIEPIHSDPPNESLAQIEVPDLIENDDEVSYFGEKPLTEEEKAAALERWNARLADAQRAPEAITTWDMPKASTEATPWDSGSEVDSTPPSAAQALATSPAQIETEEHVDDRAFEYTEDLLEHLAQTGGFEAIPQLVECLTPGRPLDDLWWAVAGLERLHATDKLEAALRLHPVIAARAALAIVGDAPRAHYEDYLRARVEAMQLERVLELLAPAIGYAA